MVDRRPLAFGDNHTCVEVGRRRRRRTVCRQSGIDFVTSLWPVLDRRTSPSLPACTRHHHTATTTISSIVNCYEEVFNARLLGL